MMKNLFLLFSFLFLVCCSLDVENDSQKNISDITSQFSTKANLLNKEYYKKHSLHEVGKNGDFGLGTLNGVDGELVILDGEFYQVDFSGKVNFPGKLSLTPFVNVKFFNSEISAIVKNKNLTDTYSVIDFHNSGNKLAAVKISGFFNSVKARSVQKDTSQTKSLDQIIQDQAVFNFNNVKGTMVGYYIPSKYYTECFTGYHFHFISEDKKLGGHVLDFVIDSTNIYIDFSDSLKLIN